MEFSSRGFQRNSSPRPVQDSAPSVGGGSAPQEPNNDKRSFSDRALENMRSSKSIRILSIVLFVSLLILFVATVFGISVTSASKEFRLVDRDNYQVVALSNDGTFFFGKIVAINSKNVILRDVYYLNTPSDENTAENNIQLVKRGCEVHSPQDQMVIMREHVSFWENLKDDGRVAQGIKQWQEQNPDGQNCENQTEAQATVPAPTTPSTPTPTDSTTPTEPNLNTPDEPVTNPAGEQE